VNFTGGTKLMSIGAFSAALNQKAPSLYVDTDGQTFVDGHTADGLVELLEGDFSFNPLSKALTVNTVAVAHGRQRVTSGRDWRPFLALARRLLAHCDDEEHTHLTFLVRRMSRMALTKVVLRTPGPPVMTNAPLASACRSAACWLGASSLPVLPWHQATAFSTSMVG
jgi:hypothetical protein